MHKPPIFNAAHSLDRAALAYPDRVNLVYGARSWSLEESALHTRRLAELFARVGVSRGDRVLFVAHNSPYHVLVYIACARLGAVFVPVSYRLPRTELAAIVDFTSPRVIIADTEVAAAGPIISTGTLTSFVIDDDPSSGPLGPGLENGFFALDAACEGFDASLVADGTPDGPEELNRHGYPSDTAALLFTGASTMEQLCAVELTHENIWWSARNLQEAFGYSKEDIALVSLPMYYSGGFNGAVFDLFTSGGCLVITRNFDAAETLKIIEDKKISIFFGVPTMYAALASELETSPVSLDSLTKPMIGGAPAEPELLERLEKLGLRPSNVWGMSEISGAGTFLPHAKARAGSIGLPMSYLEARVVDPLTFEDCEEGELIIRGPSVSRGYWHNEEANQKAYVNGWLRTGDRVRIDGELTLLGRFTPRISTGGEVVDPGEVERVLLAHPGVKDAVVVGLPDSYWGEKLVAVIVSEVDETPDPSDLQAFVGQVLVRYKVPREVTIWPSLPRDEHGVMRDRVREELMGPKNGDL